MVNVYYYNFEVFTIMCHLFHHSINRPYLIIFLSYFNRIAGPLRGNVRKNLFHIRDSWEQYQKERRNNTLRYRCISCK